MTDGATIDVEGVDYLMPGIFVQVVLFGGAQTAVGLATDLKEGVIQGRLVMSHLPAAGRSPRRSPGRPAGAVHHSGACQGHVHSARRDYWSNP
ncbi:MAG TPA: hypothetical protein VEL76_35320 [Gemmataceae bacterium]|nr:hypothetical protein [Gemmataceae bacterium]